MVTKTAENKAFPHTLAHFTRPTLIFTRMTGNALPSMRLVDVNNEMPELSQLLQQSFPDNFDTILEQLMQQQERLEYVAYTAQGFVPLQISAAPFFSPEWHVSIADNAGTIKFFCRNAEAFLATCVPLGSRYAIDLEKQTIIPLDVANKNYYAHLNYNLSGLVYACSKNAQKALKQQKPLGALLLKRHLSTLKRHQHFAAIEQATVALAQLQEQLIFRDYNLENSHTHLIVTDKRGFPAEPLMLAYEKRIDLRDSGLSDALHIKVGMRDGNREITFLQMYLFADFMKLIESLRAQDDVEIIQAVTQYLENYEETPEQNKKDALLLALKAMPVRKRQALLKLLDALLPEAQRLMSCRLSFNAEHERFERFVLCEKEFLSMALAILEFSVEHEYKMVACEDGSFLLYAPWAIMGDFSEHMQQYGIALYRKNKKVIKRTLEVEVDIRTISADWFSVHPSLYETHNPSIATEWDEVLSFSPTPIETTTEIHVFDEKTIELLQVLRKLKHTYKTNNAAHKQQVAIPRLHMFMLLALSQAGIRLKTAQEDKKILEDLQQFTTIPVVPLPENMVCTLREHQVAGYEWLAFLYQHKFGACLADEMGLGKTVQTITFLAAIYENKITSWDAKRQRPHLIVAPASVIGNWEQELQKFYPQFSTALYLGSQRTLTTDVDIILTTYDMVASDKDILKSVPFHVIIFDEAQALKNQKSRRAKAAASLTGIFNLCLTGTPVENNAQELCSIINIALPGLLPAQGTVTRLINQGKFELLREKITPFVLRRTKAECLTDLPGKIEKDVYLAMTAAQKKLYCTIADKIKKQLDAAPNSGNMQALALTGLLRLRQMCVSPALISKKNEACAPKIQYVLAEAVRNVQRNVPFLVFSQFTGVLDIVAQQLEAEKIAYVRIDGSIPALQRKKIIQDFQKSSTIFVCLLSLKTGGVGLNLTRARKVYHLDPWWNPAVENQASDRVHRIGQQHAVHIIRLLMKDSIEEKMIVLKQKKAELFNALMQGVAGGVGKMITKEDFDFLLS